MAAKPRLLAATTLAEDDIGELRWDVGRNTQILSFSDDGLRVEWGPRKPDYEGMYPPAWVPAPTLARLHSGRFRWDFVVEELAAAQLGVGFMLLWEVGPDWGFFGYLGASSTAWAYDPLTGDIVTATESIHGGLPTFPDKHRGVISVELELPRTGEGRAVFVVDGVTTPAVKLPRAAVVMPAACLLRETQTIELAGFERSASRGQ